MRLSMWTYPWDILDVGHDTVAVELGDRAGLDAVSLSTSYHAGHFFQARSPRRKSYFPEDGVIYFRPEAARWSGLRIVPKPAALLDEGDVLRELVRRRDAGGLKVNCWTVCLHNTRLGMLHPEACTRNAFGDPNSFALCPSNADARAYATTMVADLTHNYRPDCVELETISFMGFVHGYHHEKDGVGLTVEDNFLMSLCFCPACVALARRLGVDAEAARETVHRLISETAARARPAPRWPDFAARGLSALRDIPEVEAYARCRTKPVTSLAADIRAAAHQDSRVVVIDDAGSLLTGLDLGASARTCDGALIAAYDMAPAAVTAAVGAARKAVGDDRYLAAGLRVFTPEIDGAADLAARAKAAAEAGAQGINFYNYGLIPAARLDWVGGAARAARGR